MILQCGSGSPRRSIILGAFFSLLILWVTFSDNNIPSSMISAIIPPTKNTAENDIFSTPPLDSPKLRSICASTNWNATLVFTCSNNRGGPAHVRNSILNCVRYAISAGGALVLPNIALRDMDGMESSHTDKRGLEKRHGLGRKGMDYMFDTNHFVNSLEKSCPELVLIRHMEDTISNRRRGLLPEKLFSNIPASGLEHPELWPEKLGAWMEKYMDPTPAAEPIIIDLEPSFLHYPTASDGPELAATFGDMLIFRPDVRRLATSTLKALVQWHEISTPNFSSPIIPNSYLGVHLDTENPLVEARSDSDRERSEERRHEVDITYSHFSAQASAYIEQATTSSIPVIYAASGSLPSVRSLADLAEKQGISVTSKESLLSGREKKTLDALKWDQRALVDYLVLLRGQQFAGVGHSAFSWNLWVKRRQSEEVVGKAILDGELWGDGESMLYGVRGSYVESSSCMWP